MKRATLTPATAGIPRVNLMPRAETERRERAALAVRWGIGLLGALLVVALLAGGAFWLKWNADQRLAGEQARTAGLLTDLAALSEVSRAIGMSAELETFRADAMASDLKWSELFASLEEALPAGVVVTGFDLTVGAAPTMPVVTAEAPAGGESAGENAGTATAAGAEELALAGTLELRSPTAIDVAPAVRALRDVAGVAQVDPLEMTTEQVGDSDARSYIYRLRTTFDQTLYTGAYAEEALG